VGAEGLLDRQSSDTDCAPVDDGEMAGAGFARLLSEAWATATGSGWPG